MSVLQAAGRSQGWSNINHGYLAFLLLFTPWGWLMGVMPADYPKPSRTNPKQPGME